MISSHAWLHTVALHLSYPCHFSLYKIEARPSGVGVHIVLFKITSPWLVPQSRENNDLLKLFTEICHPRIFPPIKFHPWKITHCVVCVCLPRSLHYQSWRSHLWRPRAQCQSSKHSKSHASSQIQGGYMYVWQRERERERERGLEGIEWEDGRGLSERMGQIIPKG